MVLHISVGSKNLGAPVTFHSSQIMGVLVTDGELAKQFYIE
jgi:hypothetical protein